jgi:hypothetical protein
MDAKWLCLYKHKWIYTVFFRSIINKVLRQIDVERHNNNNEREGDIKH